MKKPKSSWKEAERLGPYQLHEQVLRSKHSRGELYRATHTTSGTTALVLKPAAEDGSGPPTDWRVRCISSSSPSYLAVEVEHSPRSVAPDKHSVEALLFMFEDLRAGVRRMFHAVPTFNEPRPRGHLGLMLAGTASVCALVFTLVLLPLEAQPPDGPTPLAGATPAPMSDEVPTDTTSPPTGSSLWGTEDGGVPVLARPFPSKPYKGQRRPPCKPRVEVEIMGACWVPHLLKAPCPEELYEHQGQCYTASMVPPSMPQSLEQ